MSFAREMAATLTAIAVHSALFVGSRVLLLSPAWLLDWLSLFSVSLAYSVLMGRKKGFGVFLALFCGMATILFVSGILLATHVFGDSL